MSLLRDQIIILNPRVLRQCLNKSLRGLGKLSGASFKRIGLADDRDSLGEIFNAQVDGPSEFKDIAMLLMVAKLQKLWRPIVKTRGQAVRFLDHLIMSLEEDEKTANRFSIMQYMAMPDNETYGPMPQTLRDKISDLRRYGLINHDKPIEMLGEEELRNHCLVSYELIKEVTAVLTQKYSPDPETIALFALFNKEEAEQIESYIPEVKEEIVAHLNRLIPPEVMPEAAPLREIA